MDKEMKATLEAMEFRLTGRINGNHEATLSRFGALEGRLANLELAIAGITELARSTNTLLGVLAAAVTDMAGRVARLEGKP